MIKETVKETGGVRGVYQTIDHSWSGMHSVP
jgi:hypothetical protein